MSGSVNCIMYPKIYARAVNANKRDTKVGSYLRTWNANDKTVLGLCIGI